MTDPRSNDELLQHLRALLKEGQAEFLRERPAPPAAAASAGSTSLLSKAGHQLAATYRAEVARLLLEESQRILAALPQADAGLPGCTTAELELLSREDLRARGRRWLEVAPPEVASDELRSQLRACIDEHEESAAVAARLALASLELVPRAETRLTAAVALHVDGRTERAREMLERVVAAQPPGPLRSLALENLAWFDRDAGDPAGSMLRYRRAHEACPERPAPLFSWLAGALRLGDREQALEALHALAELAPPTESVLEACLRRLSAAPATELPDTRLAREFAEEHGLLARRIVRAVLGD